MSHQNRKSVTCTFMNDSFDSSMNLFFDAEFLAKSLVSSVQSETMIDISIDESYL